jgi:mono/diheme cytochrome c family protein
MSRRVLQCVLAVGAAIVTVAFTTGGWATVTVEDLPDSLVAGEAVDLAFTIRQHGEEPMSDRRPVVEWSQGASRERVQARRDGAAGRYVAQVLVRQPGEWSVTIDSDFHESRVTLLPMLATGAGSHAPPAPSAHERGRRLFVAKGCFTCHTHAAIAGSGKTAAGPDLTEPRYADEYLARLLADPSIMPRRAQWRMPDLDLKQHEIAALVAFLNGPSSGR